MKGKSSAINSLPEAAGQRSVISTSVMSQQNVPVNNVNVTPVENRLSNHMISSGETLCTHSASYDAQSFDGWNSGEPSSRLNLQNDIDNERLKMEHVWSPLNTCSGNSLRIEESQFGAPNSLFRGRTDVGSSSYQRDRPLLSQGLASNVTYRNETLDTEYVGNNHSCRLGVGSDCPNLYKSTQSEKGQTSSISFCHNQSGGTDDMIVDSGGSSSSGTWGLSCKRKSLEGTSRQLFPGGSSCSFPQPEHGMLRNDTACFGPSSSLSLSTPTQASSSTDLPEQRSSSISASGMRTVSDVFPSSSITNNFERPLRDLGRIATLRTSQDYVPFSILSAGSARHPSPVSFRDSVERSTVISTSNSEATPGLSHGNEGPGISRGARIFTWDGSSTSRGESFSSSPLPGHRTLAREDLNRGSSSRNNAEHHIFLRATEARNSTHDPVNWSLGSGNLSNPFCSPSTSRISPSSTIHSLPNPALTPSNPPRENQRRVLEFAPWSLFPSTDVESEVHSGQFYPLPSAPNSSRDATMSSGPNSLRHHQSHPRSAFFLERLGDDIPGTPHSLRALAADMEGRRQLISEIRQVLTAMRRAENFAAEDYMVFDPFVYHGMAEIHDRHRDMRLDVDNMSYEELLALEDRIGDVSTGVSEDVILKFLKQQKYELVKTLTPPYLEPCCICKEEYAGADIIGTLDCGHSFHSDCIKQWLRLKNLCPICKTTALLT